METKLRSERSGGRRRRGRSAALLTLLAAVAAAALLYLWILLMPNRTYVTPDFAGNNKPVFYQGKMLAQPASGTKDGLKLSFDLVKDQLDETLLYEEASDSIIMTTEHKVVRMKTSELTATVNEKPFTLRFPVEKIDQAVYLPIEPLKDIYHIELRESEETGAVFLFKEGEQIVWAQIAPQPNNPEAAIPMRDGPSIKEPILADLEQGTEVMVLGKQSEWLHVQLVNGYQGYVQTKFIGDRREELIPAREPEPPFIAWKPDDGKIHITWEHVVSKNPDTSKIPEMTGLDIVSPTWFHLTDGEGNLSNLASASYVNWAHQQGYQVWALFSNGFDPERTTAVLKDYDTRMKVIQQLLAYSQMYNLQGINIDFENVNLSDKQKLVQFVREFTPLAHEQGLVVSMDVTPKSTSENWSMFYDRPALIQSIDYMMVMAYDEHWAASPVAGSVASLPWVENSVKRLLNEDKIPPEKLLLGIPFYTRIWTEEQVDGKTKVSSRAVFMDNVQRTIKEKGLEPVYLEEAGQNYIEYSEDGKKYKVWIEDEVSVKARMELVKKYNLAGTASWRRGFESAGAWQWIEDSLSDKE